MTQSISTSSYTVPFPVAVFAYTGVTATHCTGGAGGCLTGVTLVRGSGSLLNGDNVIPVQPYTVTAVSGTYPYYTVSINPPLSSTDAALAATNAPVYNTGTCFLYDTFAATPANPVTSSSAPGGATSYYDGCIWQNRNISVSGNTFVFQPSVIANGPNIYGQTNPTYRTCTSSNTNDCGSNFMQYDTGGGAGNIYNNYILANAMMSHSGFTTPITGAWNGVPSGNAGEGAWNDVWSDNVYSGPFEWFAYNTGSCLAPSGYTCTPDLAQWQSQWGQDAGSVTR